MPAYESKQLLRSVHRWAQKVHQHDDGVVAIGKFLGDGFVVAPQASMSDGLLDFVVLKDSGSLKMLNELVNVKTMARTTYCMQRE